MNKNRLLEVNIFFLRHFLVLLKTREIFLQRCATLHDHCSNITGKLQKYCRNVAVQYCNATLMQLCSNNSMSVPCIVARQRRSNVTSTLRCNHTTLQSYWNAPATLPRRSVLYGFCGRVLFCNFSFCFI